MTKYTVVIVGSGFGGQCSAINLKKQGITDFIILERRSFMGGTWCQNTYPGAAVDVQSPLYSISFEPYPWTQMFAEQHELEEYTNHVIDKHKLREKTETNANVKAIIWQEDKNLWKLETENKGDFEANFVINASGPLSTPVIPDFPGKDSFQGESFHTNDWNHDYDYTDKNVAIIGSGASAAQIIPAIAPGVKKLHVFQRSPHWVLTRPDMKFPKFVQNMLKFTPFYNLVRNIAYWSLELRIIGFKYSNFLLKLFGESRARRYIKRSITDPELRKKVTPDFTIGCKRVILSNTLYPALCRDNVELHTKEQGIKEITESGINTADGETLDLDLIIYSTGYDATDGVISYPVIGRDNQALSQSWEEFPHAYLGTTLPKFPNFFMVTGPNTGIGHTSAIHIIESQMLYIMKSIKTVLNDKSKSMIEVNVDAEEKYTNMIHSEMGKTVWDYGGCSSWYQNKAGKVIAMFPGFSFMYRRLTNNFKKEDHSLS